MPAPNHYDVLGLTPTATADEVDRRHAELTGLYGSDGAQAPMMKLIDEARRVLSNPSLRAVYDSGLSTSSIASGAPPPPSVATIPPDPAVPEAILNAQLDSQPPVSSPSKLEATQAMSTPDFDRTAAIKPPDAPAAGVVRDDRRLAQELTRRGVAPEEVERLIALGSPEPVASGRPSGKAAAPVAAAPVIPPSEAYVPKPTISLPAPRASSQEERQQADRMLTNANIARRRGQFAEAERECRAALDLIPGDAAALELYGDILQAVGRVDDALYAYQRAKEADGGRRTAEKKYAELMLLQNREIDLLRDESIPRSPLVAVLLSAAMPGAGQIYNGDVLKGLLFMATAVLCIVIIFWTPYGLPHTQGGMPSSLIATLLVFALLYAAGVIDAQMSARRGKRRSGWDV